MTLQNVKLAALQAPASNPRRKINQTSLEGLADSIKNDGVLQNLVVVNVDDRRFVRRDRRIGVGARTVSSVRRSQVDRVRTVDRFNYQAELENRLGRTNVTPECNHAARRSQRVFGLLQPGEDRFLRPL